MGAAAGVENHFRAMDWKMITVVPKYSFSLENFTLPSDYSYGDVINPLNMTLCREVVNLSTGKYDRKIRESFYATFWNYLSEEDPSDEIYHMLRPKRTIHKNTLVYKMIWYMTTVPDMSHASKAKIRLLGRLHTKVGVTEHHLQVFGTVALKSMFTILGKDGSAAVFNVWKELMLFAIHQMTFDKVTYLPRQHQVSECSTFVSAVEIINDQRNTDDSIRSIQD